MTDTTVMPVHPGPDYIPRPGWTIWTSPNNIDHLLDPMGRCITCGGHHE